MKGFCVWWGYLGMNFSPNPHVLSKGGIFLGVSFNRHLAGFQFTIDIRVALKAIYLDDVCLFVMVVFLLGYPSKGWIFLPWFRSIVPGMQVLSLLPWFHSYLFVFVCCCVSFSGSGCYDICDAGKMYVSKMFIASNEGWYVVSELF